MLRDDIIEYSLDAHHSEEEGKKKRKEIWKVTALLSIITIIEVGVGIIFPKSEAGNAWFFIKWAYIILTVIKAGYIIMVFMHLGEERKTFKLMILIPYIVFILYLIFMVLTEAAYVGDVWNEFKV
jgi:cytochrome c oxidase subunit IV